MLFHFEVSVLIWLASITKFSCSSGVHSLSEVTSIIVFKIVYIAYASFISFYWCGIPEFIVKGEVYITHLLIKGGQGEDDNLSFMVLDVV